MALPRRDAVAICAAVPDFLRFASDATVFALWGGVLLIASATAFIGDRRRMRRKDINAVGIMPWRDLAAHSAFAGFVLLLVGISGWIRG